jgi:two-component system, cell cycle sensor histidine kinase and response regulator CckA
MAPQRGVRSLRGASDRQDSAVVLLIEDDRSLRMAMRIVLEEDGYAVIEAGDGLSGLAAFEADHPDMVLLDLMLPGLDGFQTCARLRELPDGDLVPVVVITAMENRDAIDRAFSLGVTDYITKPVSRDVLRLRVQYLLRATRAEKMILRAKQEWEATVDAVSDMVILTGSDDTVIRCNLATVERLGVTFDAFLGKGLGEVVPSLASLSSVAEDGLLGEFVIDGLEGIFEASKYSLALQGGSSGTVYVVQDITERKNLQARMIASQKLADLGTLAAGVAHEINSPLQVITGLSQSLLDCQEKGGLAPDRLTRGLDVIHRNGWRCAEIVRSLRTYAHASTVAMSEHSLNALVKDTLLLIESQLAKVSNISVVMNLADDALPITCDRNQIAQVLINLLTNAQDAMPNGGTITISTRLEEGAGRVVLEVSDTGTGIPDSILANVFDPFFTTKPPGEGTGLGLSIVDGIVRAHGGEISVRSDEGRGTVFSIRLPRIVQLGTGVTSATGGRYGN